MSAGGFRNNILCMRVNLMCLSNDTSSCRAPGVTASVIAKLPSLNPASADYIQIIRDSICVS